VAAPVRSYCLTVETELIGLATLTGAPPKPDGMQAHTKCTGDVTFPCANGAHLRGPTQYHFCSIGTVSYGDMHAFQQMKVCSGGTPSFF
jgi:hypothetical protein